MASDDDFESRLRISRRTFLQYGGTLLAATLLPACRDGSTALAALVRDIDVSGLDPSQEWIGIQRGEDLLDLRLRWVNFERTSDGTMLRRTGSPGLLVVVFPPQHLGERSYDEMNEPAAEPPPVLAQLAQASRVVFHVPDEVRELPLHTETLLELALGLAMNVHANALPPPGVALPTQGAGTTSGVSDKGPLEPDELETAIELPWRLQISPNVYGRWAHATRPQVSSRGRVELWHTRLGVVAEDGRADERRADLRTARALFARTPPASTFPDGQATLTDGQRYQIVRGTADHRPFPDGSREGGDPRAMQVDRLMLSALGGWLDATTHFGTGSPLAHWIHRAAMGRDYYVEVAYRGFAYPFGHELLLLQISERKLRNRGDAAYLWKRFVLVPVEPGRRYDGGGFASLAPTLRQLPLAELRFVDDSILIASWPGYPADPNDAFVPTDLRGPVPVRFAAVDREGNRLAFESTILWVPAGPLTGPSRVAELEQKYQNEAKPGSDLRSQRLWLAAASRPGDTTFAVQRLRFGGVKLPNDAYRVDRRRLGFHPVVVQADLAIEAIKQVAGVGQAAAFRYSPTYLASGFEPGNPRELLLELVDPAQPLRAQFTTQSDKAGGFVAPNLDIRGLSRLAGPVSDLGTSATLDPAQLFPIPADPLSLIGAKLFGCVSLSEILADGIDFRQLAPRFVSDALDDAERYRRTVVDASAQLTAAASQVEQAYQRLGGTRPAASTQAATQRFAAELRRSGDDLVRRGQTLVTTLFQDLPRQIAQDMPPDQIRRELDRVLTSEWTRDLRRVRDLLVADKAGPVLYPLAPGLEVAARQLAGVLERIADLSDGVKDALVAFLRGLELARQGQVTLEWRPPLKSSGIFQLRPGGGLVLALSLRGKAQGDAPAGADLLCSLERFDLALTPDNPIIKLGFDKLQFRQKMGRKPEIDVVFGGIDFGGPLAFVQTLKEAIPLDGFSDPPGVEITPSGLHASYSLSLPPLAVGMFSLENIGISARLDVPFLGDAMSFYFAFASREQPFLLTVCGLGGTGFFGIEITPAGVRMLEAQLEFGAHLSINLGVASGAVSVMAGIYFRLETAPVVRAELTGFLRIRGAVDVLGLVSASIELRMELRCLTGPEGTKVVGRAVLEIEISIAFFSVSVHLECERKFAGANGDPSFADVMAPLQLAPGERLPFPEDARPWHQYCAAFAA